MSNKKLNREFKKILTALCECLRHGKLTPRVVASVLFINLSQAPAKLAGEPSTCLRYDWSPGKALAFFTSSPSPCVSLPPRDVHPMSQMLEPDRGGVGRAG